MHLLNYMSALGQLRGIRRLQRLHHCFVMRQTAVSSALQKINSGYRRESLQFIHGKNERAIHHAVNREPVLLRVNVRKMRNVAGHEMERVSGNDAYGIL